MRFGWLAAVAALACAGQVNAKQLEVVQSGSAPYYGATNDLIEGVVTLPGQRLTSITFAYSVALSIGPNKGFDDTDTVADIFLVTASVLHLDNGQEGSFATELVTTPYEPVASGFSGLDQYSSQTDLTALAPLFTVTPKTLFDGTIDPSSALLVFHASSIGVPVFGSGHFQPLGDFGNNLSYTLTYSYEVPEPATWGMMMLGFGMVGFGMRYRRKSATAKVSFA